jgi:hypothetical protein
MQRVLEGTGQQLPFKIDRGEARAGVDVLVARHASAPLVAASMTLDIPIGSPQNAARNRVFLQLR